MVARRLAVLLAFVLTGAVTEAHDLWLIPDFSARPGQTIKIMVHAGNRFPAPSLVIKPEQFARFEVQGPGTKLSISNARGLDKSTEAETALKDPGAYIIALEVKAQPVRLDAKEFNEYLKREGLDQIVDARAKAKKETQDGKELSVSLDLGPTFLDNSCFVRLPGARLFPLEPSLGRR